MSAFLFPQVSPHEDSLIDSYQPQVDAMPAAIVQANNPGENIVSIPEQTRGGLPDPAVGGKGGSRQRNGWSIGVFPRRQRFRTFDGSIVKGQATAANPVQGQVGARNNHGGKLWAGVRNQLADYQAGTAPTVGAYVGKLNMSTAQPNPAANE